MCWKQEIEIEIAEAWFCLQLMYQDTIFSSAKARTGFLVNSVLKPGV